MAARRSPPSVWLRGAGAAQDLPFNAGGIYHTCRVPGAGYLVIKVEDEGGKVALNTPNTALLQALFTGLGAAEDEARSYAARIADYRDPDDDRRSDGAEKDDYQDASGGGVGGPKNADFETVDELDRVTGIPADLRERAKPWLTAQGQATGVDPQTAAPALVDLLVRGSTSALGGGFASADGEGEDLPAALRSPSSRAAFTVRAIAVIADSGAIFVREAILGVTGRGAAGSRWRDWKQGVLRPDETVPPADGTMPPC